MLILVGCNHRSAPIALRERLAVSEHEIRAVLGRFLEGEGVEEGCILSTCNRVELLARVDRGGRGGVSTVKRFLADERQVSAQELDRHTYHYVGSDAARHLFGVTAGLDSMILGEPQIHGQVKRAYLSAKAAGATGVVLDRLLQHCLSSAKRVRTETGISRHAVSVAYAAVHLARQIFGHLRGRQALIIGAGKMGQLVARHLVSNGVSQVLVTGRTYNRAVRLAAEFNGRPLHWNDGLARIGEVDIVVSCTAAPRCILGKREVAESRRARRGQSLFMIDIAVPRDIEPEVNELDNVYLYDIDGLQGLVEANLEERKAAAQLAQRIILDDVAAFERWRQGLEITPTILSLREHLFEMGRRELQRARRRLGPLSAEQESAIEELARSMIRKILHRPVVHLRKSVERGDVDACTSLYREIFGLNAPHPSLDKQPAGERSETPAEGAADQGPQRILRGGKDDG